MNRISTRFLLPIAAAALILPSTGSIRAADENPYVDNWALTLPDGRPGWLGITHRHGYYDGRLLWAVGSVVPVSSVFFSGDNLYVTMSRPVERRDENGEVLRTQQFTDLIVGHLDGDQIDFVINRPKADGEGIEQEQFTGRRQPPMPPAPDLSKIRFGKPIELFNGKNLDGWRLTDSQATSGWSVRGGLLSNRPVQKSGEHHIEYGNLRTEREFTDFNLKLQARVPRGGNSGIYLRGIYEVQVEDSYGEPTDSHHMGALYSRIKPAVAAERPAGEWQDFDITLVDRHLTVVLNGKKIIDNAPVEGCTGGALWSDVTRPGPLYLQGDHAAVDYRNIVLRPVEK